MDFHFTQFSEVRQESCKYHSFGGCFRHVGGRKMLKLYEIRSGSQGRFCELMHPTRKPLSTGLQTAVRVTAIIDLIIGLLFLFAPELGFTLWPTPIAPVLSRFIGSIIVANGVGAWLVVRQGTWEGARVLFAVALV